MSRHLHPGQRVNPMSGEDSKHTSILARRGYISGEDTPRSCVGMGEMAMDE